MDADQLLTEIREANLTYLMLAQSLIRRDKAEALFRLGLSEESADLLVAHDELDLAAGDLRLKFGGGHGGQNGMRDLIAHLGDGFWRLRIGKVSLFEAAHAEPVDARSRRARSPRPSMGRVPSGGKRRE